MKMMRVKGDVRLRRVAENPNKITAIRLMWMPGIRPVTTPADTPINKATINSNIILLQCFLIFYSFVYFYAMNLFGLVDLKNRWNLMCEEFKIMGLRFLNKEQFRVISQKIRFL